MTAAATAEESAPAGLLGRQARLVGVMAVIAALALWLPLQDVQLPHRYYLPLHTVVEFMAVVAAFLVFATVWSAPAGEVTASLFFIATALFAAGWLDVAHALSYKGMPDFITPSSVEKGIAFWLLARLTVAATLAAVSLRPLLPAPSMRARWLMLAGAGALTAGAVVLVIAFEHALPRTFVEGAGVTPLKWRIEWVITALLAFAAWRYHRLARAGGDAVFPLLFGAAAVAALGELFFTTYIAVNDLQNLLGHVYKFVAYGLVYRALFVVTVRKPYQRLEAQARTLREANETLRIQALALESTATPVMVTDRDGAVRWRNRASLAVGWVDRPGAAPPLNLFGPPLTDDPQVAEDMRRSVAAGQSWRGLVQIGDRRGQRLTMDRTVTPLRDERGEVEGYVSVSENVTDMLQARTRHQRVLETALEGFWMTDLDGRLLEVNAAYCRLSGYGADELLRMRISDLEAGEQPEEVARHVRQILTQGQDRFQTRHRHKQGHTIAVEIAVTCDPEAGRLYVFVRDRSEHERAQAVRLDLERQLQQAQKMEALGQLSGGIAHDFNNILAAILGYSSLALDRLVSDKSGKLAAYLREVIAASERGRDLIRKVLTFTRTQPDAGASVVAPAAVVEEALAMLRPSIPAGIEIRSELDASLRVRIDAGELNQVLVNLVINARDAIEDQGEILIRVRRVQARNEVCAISQQRLFGPFVAIEVRDSGVGIRPEHLPRLFDPFFTTKDVGKGTGLGLSMVQGIVRRAKGHVLVDTEPGRGSCFRLLFTEVDAGNDGGAAAKAQGARAGTGQRVWIVDDEASVAGYLAELLEGAGYRVRPFFHPEAVLAAFADDARAVDLVITDLTMPGMSGLMLAERLRSVRPDLPVVLCSGYSDHVNRDDLAARGIRRVFAKPVTAHGLLEALADELAAT